MQNSETSGKKIALLISVEDTDLKSYSNTATQDGDYYRDNIEDALEDKDFDDIEKLSNPTGEEFIKILKKKIQSLKKDDLFVFYFYGHGGQKPDISGDEKDDDKKDETLVLKDREVLDDEIYEILNSTKCNAKVVFIIEACNSGSIQKMVVRQIKTPKLYEGLFQEYKGNDKSWKINKDLNLENLKIEGNIIYTDSLNVTLAETHISLKDKRKKPNLDIIYIGATSDGNNIPYNAFNNVLVETFEEKYIDSYIEFSNSLIKLMDEYHDIFPTIDFSWASKSFLQSEPFK
tara:strand:+ start:602 stop:1468 length:867 start_codon:yes stop_codon:yes gene_type:complete